MRTEIDQIEFKFKYIISFLILPVRFNGGMALIGTQGYNQKFSFDNIGGKINYKGAEELTCVIRATVLLE